MGYKIAKGAQALPLKKSPKAVLVALALMADDHTGEHFNGQEKIAAATSLSIRSVSRALRYLEDSGAITRKSHFLSNGYRTSDRYVVHPDRWSELPEVTMTTGQVDHESESPRPPDNLSETTGHSDGAEEHSYQPGDQPGDQPVLVRLPSITDLFDEAWEHWPKKENRKKALEKFTIVARSHDPTKIADLIRQHGDAHAAYTVPRGKNWVPGLLPWLNGQRWEDDLPTLQVDGQRNTKTNQGMALLHELHAEDRARTQGIAS